MANFVEFIDYIFKITENYQLNEMSRDGALLKVQTLTRHLLRAFQNLDKQGEGYEQNAVREINQKWLPQLNDNLVELSWNKNKVKKELNDGWENALRSALMSYEVGYKDNFMLYPFTSSYAKNLVKKILDDNAKFEDFGLIEDVENTKKLQFKFDFGVAKISNI